MQRKMSWMHEGKGACRERGRGFQPGKQPPARAAMPMLMPRWAVRSRCCTLQGPSSGDAKDCSTASDSLSAVSGLSSAR
jgi:hypothetical protein